MLWMVNKAGVSVSSTIDPKGRGKPRNKTNRSIASTRKYAGMEDFWITSENLVANPSKGRREESVTLHR